MNITNHKGQSCLYKPIICQEGYCQDCQIYQDYQGFLRTLGRLGDRIVKTKGIPELLIEADRKLKGNG